MNPPRRITSFTTSVGLRQDVRAPMISLLNQQLADTYDLFSQTKHAHWNVKGAEFFQIHLLYDKLAEQVEDYVDMIAERITALGGMAFGTARMASATSRLAEFPPDCFESTATLDALATRFSGVGSSCRAIIDIAAASGDAATADLLTQVVRGMDTALWMLEAHLQA